MKNDHLIRAAVADPQIHIGLDGLVSYGGHLICYRAGGFNYFKYEGIALSATRATWFYWRGSLPDQEIMHVNGDAGDDALHNLALNLPKPVAQPLTRHQKLTLQDAEAIKGMHFDLGISQRAIAKKYGVSPAAICRAISGKTLRRSLHATDAG